MNDLVLAGCRPEPLGSYLKALGVLRLVADQVDPGARGRWSGAGTFILSTSLGRDELVDFFVDRYVPTPLVAPWNSGSGFRIGGSSPAAESALRLIEHSESPRLRPYRESIAAAREVVRRGEEAGWRETGGKEFWSKEGKKQVLRLCRHLLPDGAVAWLDACVVLTEDENWSPLLGGSGGLLGRMELSVNYALRVADVVDLSVGRASRGRLKSSRWINAALFGDEPVANLWAPVGQFDPGRAGQGLVNPCDFVLTLEGTLLFASAAARRLGSASGRATLPFMVSATPVGYGSSAEGESPRGELWAPLWRRPASAAEVARLVGEGRADWSGRQAATGLDFVRAATTLGIDRGVSSFARHVFVERHGQMLLAVPVGRVAVHGVPQIGLLGQVDDWLTRTRRGRNAPSSIVRAVRAVDEAMFEAAQGGSEGLALRLQRILTGMASLEIAVGRSTGFREQAAIRPIQGLAARDWLTALDDGSSELRLAAALAAAHDEDGSCLRTLLRPMGLKKGRLEWTGGSPVVPGFGLAGIVGVLAAAHGRRAVERLAAAKAARIVSEGSEGQAPDRLVRLAFDRQPIQASAADVSRFLEGDLDEERLSQLLGGLMLLDWSGRPPNHWPRRTSDGPLVHDAVWPILLPFFHGRSMRVRRARSEPGESAGGMGVAELRPEASWPRELLAGRVGAVARRAVVRLRMAHLNPVIRAPVVDRPVSRGPRLAAALLCPLPDFQVNQLLSRIAPYPEQEGGS